MGSYSYHASKKRAVIQAGTTSYGYDANGNMTSRGGSTIGYTSYNLPNVIYSGSNSSTLSYGAYRNRYKQVAVTAGVSETTIYVGGMLEKVTKSGTTTWRHRIEGPSGLLAIVNCTGSSCDPTASTNYVHRDHLGSPELITNSAGTELVKLSFGAFGERRDRDWHGAVSSADMTAIGNSTRRGFTEHEHLDSVGLIHMNGRVYDPVLGRFLTSDPVADGLGRAGGFNRYAYVGNNPLTLVDPTGLSSATRNPQHDAGVHGPLLEEIEVTASRFWLPLGGTLAWTIVSAGSLGPAYAFVPGLAGGAGGGGSGGPSGGGGGDDPRSDPEAEAERQDEKDRPSCVDAEPQSAEASLTALAAAAAVAANNQVPTSGAPPGRSAIDPVTAARIAPMQRIANDMDWERVVKFSGRTLAFVAAYNVFSGFASSRSDGIYAVADVVIGAGFVTAFPVAGLVASGALSAIGGSKAIVDMARQEMGACRAP